MKRIILILCFLSLMACLSTPLVKPEFIKAEIPPVPVLPDMYDVRWQVSQGCYCLDEKNAKSLLKNVMLLQEHDRALAEILKGLRK